MNNSHNKAVKLIIMSDVHLCRSDWYGLSSQVRLRKMVKELNEAYEKEPYEAILFLGDYSLDFWLFNEGGSYVHHKLSNTDRFVKEYVSAIKCPRKYMLPGNHEQYGNEMWKDITGRDRQFSVMIGDFLFIMLDAFSGDLDPAYDSDGTYVPVDLDFIKSEMERYPHIPVVLCAHFFDMKNENAEFKSFIKNEDRISALFCGHDHICDVEALGEECGNKLLIHDGNYSYTGNGRPVADCMWGWREVWLDGGFLKTAYYTPESTVTVNGETFTGKAGYKEQTEIKIV